MYAIKTPAGYVAGYSSRNLCVQVTNEFKDGLFIPVFNDFTKTFKTMAAAQKFIDKYADAGFGLNSKSVEIIKLS